MDFGEERYVRVYTRKTPEWMALCWQAKALHALLLMECDRAGIIPVPMGARRVRMVAATMGMPEDVTTVGLADLLEDGRVVETAVGYVWPNFIKAQETPASPKQRMKEYRARKRELRASDALEGVTKRNGLATERLQTVTPYRAVPASLREVGRATCDAPARQLAAAVEEVQTQFFKTATTTPKSRSAKYEGSAEQLEWLSVWNEVRVELGMSTESLNASTGAVLQELLEHASAKRPEDSGRVLGLMIRDFLGSSIRSKRLRTFLHAEVWPARFDSAAADASTESAALARESRKQRYW